MRATFSTSVAAAFASCVIAACRPAAPTVERNPSRVVVTLDLARAVSRLPDPTLPSWALDATWPEADARDAFVVALGEEIVLPIGL
ncbi:MAG: hypothetical protein JNM09_32030, partial [Blastocatellia bacterium]|nr:hypothetical protein [Blastocatellia bacterium]